ncbi:uncharacterized protein LOC120107931 [Phoenix dactylifera]|uniref:Uncharacterized protein LOC120107931 n=1 Tax=Phoenix dactylifera TaxID=42345 RepID=A0A8B9A0Q9_PHODC|nr:uncharacterized protein LOC120107931 [Phoenix dactylifera]
MAKVPPHLIIALILPLTIILVRGDVAASKPQPTIQYLPTSMVEYHTIDRLANMDVNAQNPPFSKCATCECCTTKDHKNCLSMQCCYRIKCNIPSKPFGTCAFMPEACNCDSCG